MPTEVFFTFVITTGVSFGLAILGVMYKSKCIRFRCFGIEIVRDVAIELQEDMAAAAHQQPQRAGEPHTGEFAV